MGSSYKPSSGRMGVPELSNLPSNVFEMRRYRKRHTEEHHKVLYITNDAFAEFPLSPHFSLLRISSREEFEQVLSGEPSDLVVVDAGVRWIGAVEAVELTTSQHGCPIILALRDSSLHEALPLLKEAYAAGISDVIALPIAREEFIEIIQVLFKLRLAQSQLLP